MRYYFISLVILVAVLIGQIAGLHGIYISETLYLMVMHLAGGFGIGLFIMSLVREKPFGRQKMVIIMVVGALIAGLLWEAIEVYYNISGYHLWTHMYYIDTARDLANDIIGGALATLFLVGNTHKN